MDNPSAPATEESPAARSALDGVPAQRPPAGPADPPDGPVHPFDGPSGPPDGPPDPPGPGDAFGEVPAAQRRGPLWAKLCIAFGVVLVLASAAVIVLEKLAVHEATKSVTQQNLLGDQGAKEQNNGQVTITGAKNILLVGVDERPKDDPKNGTRSDSIIVLHIPADHSAAYLVSIPRDTWVKVPADPKTGYEGGMDKINGAFTAGSKNGGGLAGGFQELARTIRSLYGITFDAAAIVNFEGFQQVVQVLGGVDLYVDQETTSIHIGFDKNGKRRVPYHQKTLPDGSVKLTKVKGVRAQVYHVGYQHLTDWQALDYVRQRELLPNGDYDRERHQQQFLKAVFREILTKNVLADPGKLSAVLKVVGQAMTVDTQGIKIEDWVYAMRGISINDLVTIKTNNGTFNGERINGQSVEHLDATSLALLAAVRTDSVGPFLLQHPDLMTKG